MRSSIGMIVLGRLAAKGAPATATIAYHHQSDRLPSPVNIVWGTSTVIPWNGLILGMRKWAILADFPFDLYGKKVVD